MKGGRVQLSELRSLDLPTEEQVHIWFCRISEMADRIAALHSLLSPLERDRATGFASQDPRNKFVVGRGVLRTLLGGYLAMPATEIALAFDLHGKPRLGDTMPDVGLTFNLAHSGDWVLVGFTSNGEIGVDIERHRPVTHLHEIAERRYSGRERAKLQQANVPDQRELFFRIWTRKEAILKWHGSGLQTPLSTIEAPLEANCQAWVELPQLRERCWVRSIEAPVGYSAAVATTQSCQELMQRELVQPLCRSKLPDR